MKRLQIDTTQKLNVTAADLASQRVVVLGASGSGKSNTVAVFCEELLSSIPTTIIDPHGEYYTLKDHFGLVVAGNSENVDIPIDTPDQAADLARFSYQQRVSVVLDMKKTDANARAELVHAYCHALWGLAIDHAMPYGVVIEEAQNFIPESRSTKNRMLMQMKQFATEGRKFGIGIVASTQTTTEISKTVLKQANMVIMHRAEMRQDAVGLANFTRKTAKEMMDVISLLKVGEALVRHEGQLHRLFIRKRYTRHVAVNPKPTDAPPPIEPTATMIENLRRQLHGSQPPSPRRLSYLSGDDRLMEAAAQSRMRYGKPKLMRQAHAVDLLISEHEVYRVLTLDNAIQHYMDGLWVNTGLRASMTVLRGMLALTKSA